MTSGGYKAVEAGNYKGVLYTSRTWAQANLLLAEDISPGGI